LIALASPSVGDASFDEYYYAHCCGDPYTRSEPVLRFFRAVADRIVSDIAPKTVLDAGCAIGMLVEALRERGVDASGIDLSSYAMEQVPEPLRPYCHRGSIADEFTGRYDLIVSIEVLEHMPARDAEAAIANCCRHTDDVLFSSSPLDFKEPTHVNVHQPEHWGAEFARHGFYRDVDFDASMITPWAVRYRRSAEPLHRVVRNYERRFWEMRLESNQTREYATQLQREVQQMQEAPRLLAEARAELDRTTQALAQARDTIAAMERSVFWRLRKIFR